MIWIRSQDKTFIKMCNDVSIQDYTKATSSLGGIRTNDLGKICIIQSDCDDYICLGQYSTIEKAIKVLDMIQKHIIRKEVVFEMPQDNEV